MKKFVIKKLIYAGVYFLFAVILELVSFGVMHFSLVPTYWGINFALILALTLIVFLLPSSVASVIFAGVFMLLQSVIVCLNEALIRMSGMPFSVTMLNLTKEVGGVFTSSFINWWLVVGVILSLALTVTGMIIFEKKFKTEHKIFPKQFLCMWLICCLVGENISVLSYNITINTFAQSATSSSFSIYEDDSYLYSTLFLPTKALRKYGTFGFYYKNVANLLTKRTDRSSLSVLDDYFHSGQMSESVYGPNPYLASLKGKNIVLVVIESGEWFGINQDYTPTLYSLATNGISFSEYYARDKTNHSEAISVLGDYPSQNDPATKLSKNTLSFTLPSLLQDAGYTTNYFHANESSFYSRNITYGNNGIFGFDTGHFSDNMPVMKGYNNPSKWFYDFDLDSNITKNYYPEYTNKNADDSTFFTMHMTLSSHGGYDDLIDNGDYTKDNKTDIDLKEFGKYYEIIDGYPTKYALPEKAIDADAIQEKYDADKQSDVYLRYKKFQAGLMDLDETMNVLINDLKKDNKLDDTAFFFYADHTAYYDNQNYYLKNVDLDVLMNSKLFNIPCFTWYGGSMGLNVAPTNFYEGYNAIDFTPTKDTSSALQTGKVDKFVCSFDILPTILQLVGYNYNLNLYQGVSMFSDETSVFVSRESGIFTNDIYFDGTTIAMKKDGVWEQTPYESFRKEDKGFPENVERFLLKSVRYYEKQEMIEDMYAIDYFKTRDIFSKYNMNFGELKYMEKLNNEYSL